MAHPDFEHIGAVSRDGIRNAFQQSGVIAGTNLGISEFADFAVFDFAAKLVRHRLHAITNTQYRNAQFKHDLRNTWRIVIRHAILPAG